MKKFDIRYNDGSKIIVKASNEDMARQFAMQSKYGNPWDNKTWPCDYWRGQGLSVKEMPDG